ncbi:exoglucanase 1 precursor [Colletotrichum musicola]|uniref:Glucanase n=1 Tax=Colletotrichum musicola TaxID=2175873 RepID=A0A8H6NCM4_9PEZI|nr:exoglucanase 1 precursor [Colletotrichum musicola]
MRHLLITALLAAAASAQQAGTVQSEVHPKLTWKRCTAPGACATVQGGVTLDADFRWLHVVDGFSDCYTGNDWRRDQCDTAESCAERCALEGADYGGQFGITTNGSAIRQRLTVESQFGWNENSRVYLMEEDGERYQTFTPLGNEIAFDVDVSNVECSVNSALHFLGMDADGGMGRFEGNKAGAKYGTGYCDATCTRYQRFIGGKANIEGWTPSPYQPTLGAGDWGACCPQFDVWNSNSQAFQTSSKLCNYGSYNYHVCPPGLCDYFERFPTCDIWGCDYNPYRVGAKDFYGEGKTVDTTKKFTMMCPSVVTQFAEDKISKFFVQDGVRIDAPSPTIPGLSDENGLTRDYCRTQSVVFGERDIFSEMGDFYYQNEFLRQPLVLALAIQYDYYALNLWLDSTYPIDQAGYPGAERGPCIYNPGVPSPPVETRSKAWVEWSNIRFGPIGSTVDL